VPQRRLNPGSRPSAAHPVITPAFADYGCSWFFSVTHIQIRRQYHETCHSRCLSHSLIFAIFTNSSFNAMYIYIYICITYVVLILLFSHSSGSLKIRDLGQKLFWTYSLVMTPALFSDFSMVIHYSVYGKADYTPPSYVSVSSKKTKSYDSMGGSGYLAGVCRQEFF
jgi:hypothetical protein